MMVIEAVAAILNQADMANRDMIGMKGATEIDTRKVLHLKIHLKHQLSSFRVMPS